MLRHDDQQVTGADAAEPRWGRPHVWRMGARDGLGRVTDPDNLRVATPGNGAVVVNVVYRDVLAVGEAR